MRWLGAARGPVAAALGPGPWEAFAHALGALGYRVLVVPDAAALDAALAGDGMPDEVTLLAHGAGAREGVPWAAANPHRTRRVVLVAPEGVEAPVPPAPPPGAAPSGLARLPLLGRWLAAGAAAAAAPLARRPAPPMEAEHRALAASRLPVIAIWAAEDAVVPLRAVGSLAAWNRAAKHEVIEGAGHDLLDGQAARVAETLRDVLREDFPA